MIPMLFLLCMISVPSDVTEFDLSNGIHVISRTVPGGDVEGVSVSLVGGSRVLDRESQGIEAFALECAMTGSLRYPDQRWRDIMDLTLAQWSASYNYDYSRYHLKCLSEDLPLLLDGFADCLMNPLLDSSAVARVRSSQLASVSAELQDPDNRIWLVANTGFMGADHPYMLRPEGYPETLSSFTSEDARQWLSGRVRSGNILITHSGPSDALYLSGLLEQTFGQIPPGGDSIPEVPEFSIAADTLILEQDETLTAYSVVKFEAPPSGDPDLAAYSTACSVIDELMWQVLRTDNALTYAAYSGATDSYARNWGYMYVSTPEPVRADELMAGIFRQVASGDVEQDLVTGVANNQRTLAGIRAQSMDTQCWMLGSGHISAGDWRALYMLQDSYRNITAEDAAEALSGWAGSAGWGIIADSAVVSFDELEPLPLRGE